jgi:hypothetical protein
MAFEGVRREHNDMTGEEVDLDLTVLGGTWFEASPSGFMQYVVRVRNKGPDGNFNAAVVSDVKGATNALPYGHFELAWEGTGETAPRILHERTKHILIGLYAPTSRGFRFFVPPSPHSGGRSYEVGAVQVMKHNRWRLEFDFEVRDVDRGKGKLLPLRVAFEEPKADCPALLAAATE